MFRRLLLLAVPLVLCACRGQPPVELLDVGPVPPFAFTDQLNQPYGTEQLKGKVWIANFLFTSCPTQCPPLAQATHDLQEKLKKWLPAEGSPPVQIVSISVDPVTDTPERLKEWGAKYQADPRIWHFVTTDDYAKMDFLVTKGFMQALQRPDRPVEGLPGQAPKPGQDEAAVKQPTPLDTAHSLSFVLVDKQGHIRAFFDKKPESLAQLDAAARWLVEE